MVRWLTWRASDLSLVSFMDPIFSYLRSQFIGIKAAYYSYKIVITSDIQWLYREMIPSFAQIWSVLLRSISYLICVILSAFSEDKERYSKRMALVLIKN